MSEATILDELTDWGNKMAKEKTLKEPVGAQSQSQAVSDEDTATLSVQ